MWLRVVVLCALVSSVQGTALLSEITSHLTAMVTSAPVPETIVEQVAEPSKELVCGESLRSQPAQVLQVIQISRTFQLPIQVYVPREVGYGTMVYFFSPVTHRPYRFQAFHIPYYCTTPHAIYHVLEVVQLRESVYQKLEQCLTSPPPDDSSIREGQKEGLLARDGWASLAENMEKFIELFKYPCAFFQKPDDASKILFHRFINYPFIETIQFFCKAQTAHSLYQWAMKIKGRADAKGGGWRAAADVLYGDLQDFARYFANSVGLAQPASEEMSFLLAVKGVGRVLGAIGVIIYAIKQETAPLVHLFALLATLHLLPIAAGPILGAMATAGHFADGVSVGSAVCSVIANGADAYRDVSSAYSRYFVGEEVAQSKWRKPHTAKKRQHSHKLIRFGRGHKHTHRVAEAPFAANWDHL